MRSQYERVEAVLAAAERPLALHEIRQAILDRFKVSDSEAAISARIRDIRHDWEQSEVGTVHSERVPGKAYHRYQGRLS